jgi:hypothetical protein
MTIWLMQAESNDDEAQKLLDEGRVCVAWDGLGVDEGAMNGRNRPRLGGKEMDNPLPQIHEGLDFFYEFSNRVGGGRKPPSVLSTKESHDAEEALTNRLM